MVIASEIGMGLVLTAVLAAAATLLVARERKRLVDAHVEQPQLAAVVETAAARRAIMGPVAVTSDEVRRDPCGRRRFWGVRGGRRGRGRDTGGMPDPVLVRLGGL